MPKILKPYIGIRDFTNPSEIRRMKSVFQKNLKGGSECQLGVGVMMNRETLNGANEHSRPFPKKELIKGILSDDSTFNCLQYTDHKNRIRFVDYLSSAIYWGGPFINALQLDMIWPNPGEVKLAIERSGRNIEVILQIGGKALELANNNCVTAIKFLEKYREIIDRVLIDHRTGHLSTKPDGLITFARNISKEFPDFGLVVVGDTEPTKIDLVRSVVEELPNTSIGTQIQLRQSGSTLDPVDWYVAKKYLVEALKILK